MQPANSRPFPNTLPFQIHAFHPLLTHPIQIHKAFFPFPFPIPQDKIGESPPIRRIAEDVALNGQQQQEKGTVTAKKGSVYHNFQKHLVTTLKINVHLPNQKQASSLQKLAGQLWQYFIKSRKPTKRFLYSLLNSAPASVIDQENKMKTNYDHIEFQAIAKDFSLQQLQEAQTYLRLEILRQSKKLVQSGLMSGRRMLKVQEFEEYFQTFINDLQSNDLSLRLSKKKLKAKQAEDQGSNIKQEKGQV